MQLTNSQFLLGLSAALALAACGGGGGSSAGSASSSASPTVAQAGSTSSGTLTAFGSVFLNGHEFSTSGARVFDDDVSSTSAVTVTNTSASNTAASGLAVGMTVDVRAADDSSSSAPHAGEIHIHPLARGSIDWSDSSAGTLQVMGQTVALSTTTVFRDDRACVAAATCTAITSQAGLTAADLSCAPSGSGFQNQGGGSTPTPGLYAQVFGLTSVTAGASTIQATLVRLLDAGTMPVYKAEGDIGTVGSGTPPGSFTINGLTLDTALACTGSNSCAYSAGTLVAARGRTAPTVTCGPTAITVAFKPSTIVARHSATLTAGATVELEGVASNVVSTTSPATFTLDGVTIQVGSALTLPAAGDRVEVLGTVNTDLTVTATSIRAEESHAQMATPFLMQDTLATGAVTGSAAPYDLAILGTHVVLDAHTRFFDRTTPPSAANPFNITTAATYLAGLGTPTVVVVGYQDTSTTPAVFHALVLEVVAASTNVRLGGLVTSALGGGSSIGVDGITVSVTGGTTVNGSGTVSAIQSGDLVLVTTGTETLTGSTVTGVTAQAIKDFHHAGMQPD